jgi:hypothetical protein
MKQNPSHISVAAIVFALLSLFAVSEQALAQDKARKIDELMALYYDYGQFNGSVLVAEKGSVIYLSYMTASVKRTW